MPTRSTSITLNITTNTTTTQVLDIPGEWRVQLSNTFGGASAAIGIADGSGQTVTYSTKTSADYVVLPVGSGDELSIVTTGGTGIDIDVTVKLVARRDEF